MTDMSGTFQDCSDIIISAKVPCFPLKQKKRPMSHINIDVGIFFCSTMRNFLDKCKFYGLNISYIESSGWIYRRFEVKDEEDHINWVNQQIQDWISGKE
jgi:hypothetical protein